VQISSRWPTAKRLFAKVQELDNGNWVIGLLSVRNRRRRVSYLARIDEVIDRAVYFKRFSEKRLDNFYIPSEGGFLWLANPFHTENGIGHKSDMASRNVLLSHTFFKPDTDVVLPPAFDFVEESLRPLHGARGHRKFAVPDQQMHELLKQLIHAASQLSSVRKSDGEFGGKGVTCGSAFPQATGCA